jgi:uncharacterized protein YdiU (UPF0061 family)
MSITGESFDYGPYAFIPNYNPQFTAASFDYGGRYSYGNQPFICKFNLELLQAPLVMVMSAADLEAGLAQFDDIYHATYQQLMFNKLGFAELSLPQLDELLKTTIQILRNTDIGYHHFFAELTSGFNYGWREAKDLILENASFSREITDRWRELYHICLDRLPETELDCIKQCLEFYNPQTALLRTEIERIWQAIDREDNWQPFEDLVKTIQNKK